MSSSTLRRKNKRPRIKLEVTFNFFLCLILSLFSSVLLYDEATTTTKMVYAFTTSSIGTNARKRYHPPHRHWCRHHSHREQIDILSGPKSNLLPDNCKEQIMEHLQNAGIIWEKENHNDGDESALSSSSSSSSSEGLLLLARDFVDRPEVFSSLLISDFGFPPLVAHQTRALAMAAIRDEIKIIRQSDDDDDETDERFGISSTNNNIRRQTTTTLQATIGDKGNNSTVTSLADEKSVDADAKVVEKKVVVVKTYSDKEFRSTVVNKRAQARKRSVNDDYNYGLPKDYANHYPKLALELDDYYIFMTQPTTYSQESPIRDATAKVYMNHAKLFLGWCSSNQKKKEGIVVGGKGNGEKMSNDDDGNNTRNDEIMMKEFSLFDVVPNKEKESANNIIQFVLWLRSRDVSVSYEANILRGITKLLKYRFSKESNSDPLEGKNNFDDIPIIKEVRKLHRDANQRQRLAPRSSDESKKWITWEDYLGVTRNTKNEVLELIQKYELLAKTKRKYTKGDTERLYSLEQIRITEAYQRYLILAIFSSIPDRQRTIRELEVGRTLIKDTETDCWVVKHGPNDYKTGKHYGERPAMQLAEELTPAIDDFIANWRPALYPSTNSLFVQSRTGKPMTGNSIFKRVVRCCFKYTGKSVNPHLLRDIIVTHVRETEASEKELEALALYMGHSIQMQRSSYDRRTLSTKIAPAIKLMKSVNNMENSY
ncbi:MAG: hypothetical protein ACI8RD_010745 [Bacillariaceae sp.]|jgi:hypothetical protein